MTSNLSTSSVEGSPVSPLAWPDEEELKPTPDGSGPSSSACFAIYDPDTSSWKMSLGCLFGESETFSETWPPSGMTRNGRASQQPPLVRRTSGGASSLLPTETPKHGLWSPPQTGEANGGGQHPDKRKKGGHSVYLRDQVKQWPTPTQSDATGGPGSSGRAGGPNLRTAVTEPPVESWPTPRARDWKGSGKDCLDKAVKGSLNPDWVEILMGFPAGWTEVD